MKKEVFKSGDYIVLLSGFDGENSWINQIPINYCYRLNRDSYFNGDGFGIELDVNGVNNGWVWGGWKVDNKKINRGITFRHASVPEVREYILLGKPYDINNINNIKTIKENKKLYNKSLLKLLQKLE